MNCFNFYNIYVFLQAFTKRITMEILIYGNQFLCYIIFKILKSRNCGNTFTTVVDEDLLYGRKQIYKYILDIDYVDLVPNRMLFLFLITFFNSS